MTVVELVRRAIGHPALGKDENVFTTLGAERIGVDCNGFQVDVAVLTGSLAGGGAVEVPLLEENNVSWGVLAGRGLWG